jgi:hypothetical protein
MPEAEAAAVETVVEPVVTPAEQRDVPASIDELAAKFSEELEDGSAEAEPETAPAEEEKPKTETPDAKTETPAFDPKALGIPESYWNCKSAEEVVQLAEKRRADADSLRHAQDTELGDLRKKVEAVGAPKPDAAPGQPAEWSKEQREEFTALLDEKPEAALSWLSEQIQGPLVAKITTLEQKLAAVEGKAEKVITETKADREAREDREAHQEFTAFAKEHPDAEKMRGANGALVKAFKAVNAGRQEVNDAYPDLYGLAKLAESKVEADKELYPEVLKHMRRGCRFAEAQDIAEAVRARAANTKAEQVRLAEEAKRRGRVATIGKGAGSPGSRVIKETSIDALLEKHY